MCEDSAGIVALFVLNIPCGGAGINQIHALNSLPGEMGLEVCFDPRTRDIILII
jgi:hypothetical protein